MKKTKKDVEDKQEAQRNVDVPKSSRKAGPVHFERWRFVTRRSCQVGCTCRTASSGMKMAGEICEREGQVGEGMAMDKDKDCRIVRVVGNVFRVRGLLDPEGCEN